MGVNCVGKLCKNPIHLVCILIVRRFFWPKIFKINWALSKTYNSHVNSFFLHILFIVTCLFQIFPMDHSNRYTWSTTNFKKEGWILSLLNIYLVFNMNLWLFERNIWICPEHKNIEFTIFERSSVGLKKNRE